MDTHYNYCDTMIMYIINNECCVNFRVAMADDDGIEPRVEGRIVVVCG